MHVFCKNQGLNMKIMNLSYCMAKQRKNTTNNSNCSSFALYI